MLVHCGKPKVKLQEVGDRAFEIGYMCTNYVDDLGRRFRRIRGAKKIVWLVDTESLKEVDG